MQVSVLRDAMNDLAALMMTLCRLRRVKCGEEKPYCLRCTSSGRQCGGYLAVPRPRSQTLELQPYHGDPNTMRMDKLNIGANDQERRGFQFFCEKYVGSLSERMAL